MNTQLVSISASELSSVIGGAGGPPPVNHNDAAGEYGRTLKKDWNDFQGRAAQTAGDLKAGRWGDAAVHFGGTLVNEVKMVSDAAKPIKDLIGLTK